jgi:hypothetical protein
MIFDRTFTKPFFTQSTPVLSNFESIFNGQSSAHSAGYDALVTGWIFCILSQYIGSKSAFKYNGLQFTSHLLSYQNVINIMRSDCSLELEKPTPFQDRSNVFYLTGLSLILTVDLIKPILSAYGGYQIYNVDDKSVFIRINDKRKAEAFTEELCNPDIVLSNTALDHVKKFKDLMIHGLNVMKYDVYEANILSPQLSPRSSSSLNQVDMSINSKKRTRDQIEESSDNDTEDEPPRKKRNSCTVM